MKIYALSDFHLSLNSEKPMDIFGGVWENYWEKIKEDWKKVSNDDIVLIPGDISWAMSLEQAEADLKEIESLKGRKVILRGNHDYWWSSIKKVREKLGDNMYALQNDVVRIGNVLIFGSRGWNAPDKEQTEEDVKIYNRELERLKLSVKAMEKERKEGDTVVGMTHFPPFGATFAPSAVTDIFNASGTKKVVYGHLHGKSARAVNSVTVGGVEYILTSCDLVGNKLVEVAEIESD